MTVGTGIAFAFVAMLCWGFGDFMIQKSTRKVGNLETLFFISIFGTIVLLPFVFSRLPEFISGINNYGLILFITFVILFIAALLDFEALKEGKLAIVEPIWTFEVPASAVLAYFVLGESLNLLSIILIAILIIGLVLVSFKEKFLSKTFFLEKGVALAFFAAFVMGAANFFVGWSSRVTDPIMAIFVLHTSIAIICAVYLFLRGMTKKTEFDFKKNLGLLLFMCIADTAAWIAFAFAMDLAPIGISVALSESYIIVAVLLGIFWNREKIQRHQKIGLIIAVIAAIILAAITA